MTLLRSTTGPRVAALLIFTFSSCEIAIAQAPATAEPAQRAQTTPAATQMTIYRNGRIYTNDPSSPWAEAILVRGEEILAVGDDDEVSALAETGARVIDLEKHFVMPGFNDAHVHIGGAGQDWLAVRLNGV